MPQAEGTHLSHQLLRSYESLHGVSSSLRASSQTSACSCALEPCLGPKLSAELNVPRSNLLEDSCEPFELLPGARLGPALIAVLWMLFAPRRIFSRWRSAEDAVNSMQDAQAQAIDRTPQAAQTLAGTHCGDLQQDVLAAVHPGSEAVQACTWLPRTAPTALLQAVECRAACYSAGPAAPRLRAPVGDRTLCAALTLIADEQEILEGCLKSIRNYIPSPRKRHRPSDMY